MTETMLKMRYDNKPKIVIESPSFGTMMNCAVRYGLGRMSYIVGSICDYVTPLIPYLDLNTLYVINADITKHAQSHDLGMEQDAVHWLALRKEIQAEIDRRKS